MNNQLQGKSLDDIIREDKKKKNLPKRTNTPVANNQHRPQSSKQRLNQRRQNLQRNQQGIKLVVGKQAQAKGVYRKQVLANQAVAKQAGVPKTQGKQAQGQQSVRVPTKKGLNRIQKSSQRDRGLGKKSVTFAHPLNSESNQAKEKALKRRQLLRQRMMQDVQGNPQKRNLQAKQNNQRGMPPQIQQQNGNQPETVRAFVPVMGSIEERKLKIRNLNDTTVTKQDLHALFGKCGPIISASFDKNNFGQYFGSATVVYAQASAAKAAIREYNGAQLDDRVMKIEYALRLSEQSISQKISQVRTGGQPMKTNKPLPMKKGPNAIQKSQSRDQSISGPPRGQSHQNVVRGRGGKTLVINKQNGGRGESAGGLPPRRKDSPGQRPQQQNQNSAGHRLEIRKQRMNQNQQSRGGNMQNSRDRGRRGGRGMDSRGGRRGR